MKDLKDKIRIILAEFKFESKVLNKNELLKKIPKDLHSKLDSKLDWMIKNEIDSAVSTYLLTQYKKESDYKKIDSKLEEIKHFSDLIKTKNVSKLNQFKWDDKLDVNQILDKLKSIESEWQKSTENEKDKWIEDSEEPKKTLVVEVNNKFSWWDLHTNDSKTESRAMGHCGTDREADTLISLREIKKEGDKILYKPHLTFSISKNHELLQAKGPHNAKPDKKYHGAILKLLQTDKIHKILGGSYKPESDFMIADILEEGHKADLKKILEKKPDLDHGETLKGIDSYEEAKKKLDVRLLRKWVVRNNDKMSEEDKEDFVEKDMAGLHYILNPSEEMQLKAVEKDPHKISLIRKPTEKVQLLVLKKDAKNIRHINNPSEKVQLEAVRQDSYAIKYINNPSEKVQLVAVKNDGWVIDYIKNPSEEVQIEAVRKGGWILSYIKDPSEEVQIEAVKQDGDAIKYINNPSEKVQLEAVKRDGDAIQYIKNPSEEAQLEAVKDRWRYNGYNRDNEYNGYIRYIENPSEEVQLKAVKENIKAFEHIKNPTKKVIEYVEQHKSKKSSLINKVKLKYEKLKR